MVIGREWLAEMINERKEVNAMAETRRLKGLGLWLGVLVVLAACSGKGSGPEKAKERKAQPAVPVVEGRVGQKTIPEQVRAIGNTEAYATVAVKSRVDGEIVRIDFREGDTVRAGQPLFTIDPRPFQAQLDQVRANLARDAALLENARTQERRYQDLLERHFVSKEMFSQFRTNAATAAAVVQADEAALRSAQLQLSYSSIHSPIDGATGYLRIQAGNLVKANDAAPLVVINQVSPIYVTFSVPEQHFARIRKLMAEGPLAVEAVPSRSAGPAEKGRLTFLDNAVDMTTGTIRLKGAFANKSRILWPGQFADVTLTLGEQPDALVVPSQAVQTGPEGQYVYVIRQDLTAEQRRVAVDRTMGGETVIRSGLEAGERIVIDGQFRLSPGAKVNPKPAP